jgi:hypothetical protein
MLSVMNGSLIANPRSSAAEPGVAQALSTVDEARAG